MRGIERTFDFTLAAPREEVFRLLADARNLNRVTPPWFQFEMLRPEPGRMRVGHEIDYWLRWRCLRVRWQSRVTEWEPPGLFTYEQARGPFKRFIHEHQFFKVAAGTRVVDRLVYEPPGGGVSDRLFVGPDLARIFAFRAAAVAAAFSSNEQQSVRLLAVAD